ncbi:MAG: GntR family transcriptional regulator [Bacteroidetes bacterium]|nr:GntR family transcriptional regulator [Bacteroidota bacterium]
MIHVGQYNTLKVLRNTSVGFYLGDDEGEDVLLPIKYIPEGLQVDDQIEVFIYRDSEDRKIATTLKPKIELNQFALLEVKATSQLGAFMDWGLEKDLMVPFSEQKVDFKEGRWYVVCLCLDEKTDRLFGSSRIDKFLDKSTPDFEVGEEVECQVYHHSELGYSTIVNQKYSGLLYDNEVFQRLHSGQIIKAFVKLVRPDNKIDLSLHPMGYEKANDSNEERILNALSENQGSLPYSDKTNPEVIYEVFGMSKKAFKKAIGGLYRERKIRIEEDGIHLT